MKERITISTESRTLLFYAILSNTINFKNKVTTERDIEAAKWLQKGMRLRKNYLKEFMKIKSRVGNLSGTIKDYIGVFDFSGNKICISQLEITGTKKFVAL